MRVILVEGKVLVVGEGMRKGVFGCIGVEATTKRLRWGEGY